MINKLILTIIVLNELIIHKKIPFQINEMGLELNLFLLFY